MRILVISNFYPPHYVGGYELACKDVVDGLRKRGHEVFVLTSTYGVSGRPVQDEVYRWLHFYWHTDPVLPFHKFIWTQVQNNWRIVSLVNNLAPDVIHVWNMQLLGHPLLQTLMERQQSSSRNPQTSYDSKPAVFAISDRWLLTLDMRYQPKYQHWVKYWEHIPGNRVKQKIKPFVKRLISNYFPVTQVKPYIKYAHFFSRSLQQQHAEAGIIPENYQIIYHGVPIEHNSSSQNHPNNILAPKETTQHCIPLLYCGQLLEQKGIHTAIEAMSILRYKKQVENVRLTIIGPQPRPDYVAHLQDLIEKYELQHVVKIHDSVPRQQLEDVYNHHEFLIFPSIWEEPFSITILEAMAHGLAVISTPTGGSAEILRDGENSMVFPAEDAHELANRIELLIQTPELVTRIKKNAINTVRSQYSLEKVIDEVERYLTHVLEIHSHEPC